MKLFIKLVIIAITSAKYLNWQKVNQDLAMSLANSRLMFHPETEEARKYLTNDEVRLLVEDI
tara:strand:+ start:8334 stop:8519 length:186 start_codon:yes stop_codon:yes gene_type:complete